MDMAKANFHWKLADFKGNTYYKVMRKHGKPLKTDIDAVLHDLHLEGFEPEKDAELMANLDKLQNGEVTLDELIEAFRLRHHITD